MVAPSSSHPVLIVGAGFSGTMVALQLARLGVRAVLVDRAAAAGRGIAYGTGDPAHLLNVPAGKMGAWADAPEGFAEAIGAEQGAFAERRDFGAYLRGQLEAAVAAGAVELVDGVVASARPIVSGPSTIPASAGTVPLPSPTFHRRQRAAGAFKSAAPVPGRNWLVTLDDGRELQAGQLVLATGNGRPARFVIPGWPDDAMVQDPWGAEAGERLREAALRLGSGQADGGPLLLIGTGLTMVDVVLTLDRLGYRGAVTAVSRRGLVPRAHAAGVAPMAAPSPDEVPERLADAVAWLRARGAESGWRAAVDSLRPVSQALWAGWPEEKKARFVRHARPWWDVHRHRIAPQAAAVLERWQGEGRLRVMAGPSIRGCAPTQDERVCGVRIRRRGGGEVTVAAALAVNCTGPSERLKDSANPLLRQMLGEGLVAPGALGLGVAVDDESRAGEGLWAMGPLTKGRWWEIIAVPDIRVQAEAVAERIAATLAR